MFLTLSLNLQRVCGYVISMLYQCVRYINTKTRQNKNKTFKVKWYTIAHIITRNPTTCVT